MRDFPAMTEHSVRCTMFGLVPSIHNAYDAMLASDEYADQVAEFCDLFNLKRDYWLTLEDDRDLLLDLISLWGTLEERQLVARSCVLRLIASVPGMSTFPWDEYDAEPLPLRELFHLDRESAPSLNAWFTYLHAKSLLRDETVVPEIMVTWNDSPNAWRSARNLQLVYDLAACASDSAVELLCDRWLNCANDRDRNAAQLELCLLRHPGVSPPKMTDLEVERSGVALLAHSLRLHAAHPVLLRYLQPDNQCYTRLRPECLRRPHIRKLCRGPEGWSQNLIRYLCSPQYDLPE